MSEKNWPAKGDVITMSTTPGAPTSEAFTGVVTFTPADGWHELSVDYASDNFEAKVPASKFPSSWTWAYVDSSGVTG
ncbi:hypothetical protein [Streptomyces sp. NPDC088752]|uniref:hypothetical protein n=1 Tax=Streptomyces sp. NPDC088752 TaxID=3154963 RepID=UPI00341FFAE0